MTVWPWATDRSGRRRSRSSQGTWPTRPAHAIPTPRSVIQAQEMIAIGIYICEYFLGTKNSSWGSESRGVDATMSTTLFVVNSRKTRAGAACSRIVVERHCSTCAAYSHRSVFLVAAWLLLPSVAGCPMFSSMADNARVTAYTLKS